MSNNYPPGVSGNEPAIDGSQERLESCPGCGRDGYGTWIAVSEYGSYLVCNSCGHSFATDDGPDPDEQYEKKAGYY